MSHDATSTMRLLGRAALETSESNVSAAGQRSHELYLRHRERVNRLVYRLLGPDSEHDDIVQEVFVRVMQRADSLRDPSREAAWVARVTVNLVRNQLRRRRVRRIVELWPRVPERSVDLEPRLLERDLARRGYALLEALDPRDRIVLLLRRVEDQSIEDVADACGCSRSTVKRRLARAEAKVTELLRAQPELRAQMHRPDEEGGESS